MNAQDHSSARVRITDLVVRYGEVTAVGGASLELPGGSLTALVGPSGCGKTTLLRAVAGFEVPAAGTIEVRGRTVAGPGVFVEPERRAVGMVFQDGALFPHLTVGGNVAFGVAGHSDRDGRVREALGLVGLAELAERWPDELSGGQQQRVALARALAPRPEVVLLDEPFANLDAGLRQRVRDEVRTILERAETTALLVTHDQEEALAVADRVAIMDAGRILQVGRPEEVYRDPATPEVARLIGEGQLVACEIADRRLRSPLGTHPCHPAPAGPAQILVRPEDLVLLAPEATSGIVGRVAGRRFFGHDLLRDVVLDSGLALQVRELGTATEPQGEIVRVALRAKAYRVFPKGAAGITIALGEGSFPGSRVSGFQVL